MARPKAVIIGAGALGLGFLAERMAHDYDLCLADLASREPVLRRLAKDQGYALNLCQPGGIEVRHVKGSFSIAPFESSRSGGAFASALEEADLVLTAAGPRALPDLVRAMAPILNARTRRVWLLFCENGLHIAARYRKELAAHVILVDTVMSRMCRFADPEESGYVPLGTGSEQKLVVEAYSTIPLDRALCGDGPFSSSFDLVKSADFRMWEDIKLFMHNGLHAFLSYHAYLEGTKRFPDISAPLRAEALRVMYVELIPAIVFHHSQAESEKIEAYGRQLFERLVNPHFNDSIERGVRGVAEKLAPGERLLGGRDYIKEAGIEPLGYATTIRAAQRIAQMTRGEGKPPLS